MQRPDEALLIGRVNPLRRRRIDTLQPAVKARRATARGDAIEAVDEKLNALINVLPMLQHPGERLDTKPLRDGDLSASGISFVNQEPLAPGTCMYVRLMLAPSYYYIEAFARVVRSDPHADARFPHRVAVQFEMISDEQRELLIRYTMSREAQLLRARSLSS